MGAGAGAGAGAAGAAAVRELTVLVLVEVVGAVEEELPKLGALGLRESEVDDGESYDVVLVDGVDCSGSSFS